ncbi:MAG: hypothetical protein UT18_C0025G0010 [candidate division CPR2 bacterium GW2011_GWC2_39_10]|uniref:Uncharacterized protein n=1 Tax=candidate division CPR2 bacterium GW2011_GWC2_39_10 TaxID=1618345 RepID=A0A0G0LMV0_UNCC2|nr:MAG: hypothetical protein UT18_C0025G0010 [candidate division CPR2 bacterium GW2011_GWC2_39_10]
MKSRELCMLDVINLFESLNEYDVYVLKSKVKELELMLRGRISMHAGNLQINNVDEVAALKGLYIEYRLKQARKAKYSPDDLVQEEERLNAVANKVIEIAVNFIPKSIVI